MSKSAKRRQAKKARDAAAEESAPPAPTPTPEPKSAAKAKAKAATPAAPPKAAEPPKAEPKSKAKAKAEPKAEPVVEAKAKGKAEAKPKAAAAEQPKAQAKAKEQPAQPKAKEQPKAASKAKAKAKPAEPPKPKEPEIPSYVEFDDGKGGEWEEISGKTKKQEKQAEKKKQKEIEEAKKKQEEEEAAKKAEADKKAAEIAALKAAKQAQKQAAKAAAAPKATVEEPKPVAVTEPVKPAANTTTPAEPEKPQEPPDVTATVQVPDGKIGRVIGPGGSNIRKITEETGIKKIDTSSDVVTIIGPAAAVPLAEAAIKELIEKGFMQLSYKDFAEGSIQVHPSCFPDIIGQRGAVINDIKKATEVEIKIPEVPKGDGKGSGKGGADSGKKYKVEIIGDKDNVEKAKEIINAILMYGHHEVTHPDIVHEEMEIPQECYGFIIGRGGSELRHIQNNYEVKVNIPRQYSVNDKVVITGLSSSVERTVKHINKLLSDESDKAKEKEEKAAKGEKAPRKRDEDDEGPMEPWMAAYMKTRK